MLVGDDFKTFEMWKILFAGGVFTNPVISPAVPPGHSMIRVAAMATHTKEQIDRVLNVFEDSFKKMGIPKNNRTPVTP